MELSEALGTHCPGSTSMVGTVTSRAVPLCDRLAFLALLSPASAAAAAATG